MTLHLVSLPHTQTTGDYVSCAYTQKVIKFCEMMADRHEILLYAGDYNEAPCAELVPMVTLDEQVAWFGPDVSRSLPAIEFDEARPYWRLTNARVTVELSRHYQTGDLVLFSGGRPQWPIAQALPHVTAIEPFVGYSGTFTRNRVYESHAWRHHCYGLNNEQDGNPWDAVVPNYFRPDDFPLVADKGESVLYLGRMIARKGVAWAVEATERAGVPLVMAGPGARTVSPGLVVCDDGTELTGDHVTYVGFADADKRAALMGAARALICPTQYVEPFGGVAVEAMLCGTPVLSTDWGAFTETVGHGRNGYRCTSPDELAAHIGRLEDLDNPITIRADAARRYSLEAVAPMFDRYFDRFLGGTRR